MFDIIQDCFTDTCEARTFHATQPAGLPVLPDDLPEVAKVIQLSQSYFFQLEYKSRGKNRLKSTL